MCEFCWHNFLLVIFKYNQLSLRHKIEVVKDEGKRNCAPQAANNQICFDAFVVEAVPLIFRHFTARQLPMGMCLREQMAPSMGGRQFCGFVQRLRVGNGAFPHFPIPAGSGKLIAVHFYSHGIQKELYFI